MNDIQFSANAVNLIAGFEGFKPRPYVDPATHGEPITIAYGSTYYCNGVKVTLNDIPVTKETGLNMLLCHLNKVMLPMFKQYITTELNQNEVDALGSLVYNIGNSGFEHSHVLTDINQGILSGDLEYRWMAWDRAAGQTNPSLLARRQKEYEFFTS